MDQLVRHAALNSLVAAFAGGFLLILVARKIRVSAIVLLLVGGVGLGPQWLNLVQPQSLESVLSAIVSLAVAIILFEGGLTLDLRGYQRGSTVITRLLSFGVLITWFGAAAIIHFLFATSVPFSLLGGSLVIVTGPTVIGPLLKRIKIQSRLHSILHWEGVLIDPIGVFIAVLCFEWLVSRSRTAIIEHLALRILSGVALGGLGGVAIVFALRRKQIPENLQNAFTLVSAVLIFGLTERIISEAGLLSVTLAGFVVGWLQPVELKQIRRFKAEITDLLIGFLFVLLSARLELKDFHDFGLRGLGLVAAILFLVRPASVFICTLRSSLTWRERLFLCWVAPRGIVAASMASLFAIALTSLRYEGNARFLVTFTFSVIVATVVLQGFTASWVAASLGLRRPEPFDWLIVNADLFGRRIAQFIRDHTGLGVLLLDTNPRLIAEARAAGLPALCDDALGIDLAEDPAEFQSLGSLLALTDNADLNELLCQRWSETMGRENVYRWRGANATTRYDSQGQIVFPDLVRPSIVAAELIDGHAVLSVAECLEVAELDSDGQPLLIVRGSRVIPIVTAEEQLVLQEGDKVLVLQRSGRNLARSVSAGRVMDLEGSDLSSLYDQMLEVLISVSPNISRTALSQELRAPGALLPSMLSRGVAVPHTYSSEIDRHICIVGRLRKPLRAEDYRQDIRIIFLLLSPAGDPEGHLATLGEIARICSNPGQLEALLRFSRPEEARRYILRRALT